MQSPISLSGIIDAMRFWGERKNQVGIEYLGMDYSGAEIHPNSGDLLIGFTLQFDVVNQSTNRAEDVAYSLEIEEPPQPGETRPSTYSFDSVITDRLESRYTFEPLMIRTDFSNYMIITNDHPRWAGTNKIRIRAPFSWDVNLRIKTTSTTHRGSSESWPVLTFLMEWMKENYGKAIEELEHGLFVNWERELPSDEQMQMEFGNDLTLPPA